MLKDTNNISNKEDNKLNHYIKVKLHNLIKATLKSINLQKYINLH